MWAQVIVKAQIAAKGFSCSADAVIGFAINFFILDRPPQPLDKNIVAPCAFSVHADLDACLFQHVGKGRRRELAALVRIEYFRFSEFGQSLLDSRQDKTRRVKQSTMAAR